MKVKEVTKNVYCVICKNKKDLGTTFLRFQEHYESPKFKGKIFTHEEFRKWYIKNSPKGKKTGKFTYFQDWAGFNIPSYVLKPFYNGMFNPLSIEEKKLLKFFKQKKNTFYIIGVFHNVHKDIIKHEICHGLFYTNPPYRKEVMKIINSMNTKQWNEITSYFKKHQGYHKDVWKDEAHAYIMNDLDFMKRRGVNVRLFKNLTQPLNHIFSKYSK